MLKHMVDFACLGDWIGRREILEIAIAFPSCGAYSRKQIQSPAGETGHWIPHRLIA
jgi:hypothetical protein